MSEQNPQAPTEDTPDHAAPTEGQQTENQVNWEKRYTDLQPEYTRASQEAAQYRDLVTRAQSGDAAALEQLGLEFADQEDTTAEYGDDPYAETLKAQEQRIAAQEQRWEQFHQEQEVTRIQTHLDASLGQLPDLDPSDHEWVALRALNNPPLENGLPDVKAAYEALVERDTQAQKRWAQTKKSARVSPVGQAGTQSIPPSEMSADQRVQYMSERFRAESE